MELLLGILIGAGVGILLHGWWSRRAKQLTWTLLQRISATVHLELAQTDPLKATNQLTRTLREQQAIVSNQTQELENWLSLVESMPLGFIQVDEYNLVIHCNPAAQNLLQIKYWQPRIKVLLEWVRSYELDQLVEQARQRSTIDPPPYPILMKEWLFYPSGETKAIPIRGWAVSLSLGQTAIFLEDRIEAKLLAQQRDRWASDVAHELKTPLTSIRLVAETLQAKVDPTARSWVDRLLNETIRLTSLVQDLLELSSLNLGSAAALQMRLLDLIPLLEEAWQSLEPQAKPRGQALEYQGPDQLMLVGDGQRLYRLFLNLLDNSIKYGKPDTSIHIRIQSEGSKAWVEVYDHGIGLPPDTFEAVFEPFYRTDTARDRSSGGTGLGLAIVRQIVEAHGGTIQACNHPETGGLWIQLSLSAQSIEVA